MSFSTRGLLTGNDRYGYDGSWSAISLRVGTPPQWVDVMVDTVSSETWLVGPGGCPGNSKLEMFLCSFRRCWNSGQIRMVTEKREVRSEEVQIEL